MINSLREPEENEPIIASDTAWLLNILLDESTTNREQETELSSQDRVNSSHIDRTALLNASPTPPPLRLRDRLTNHSYQHNYQQPSPLLKKSGNNSPDRYDSLAQTNFNSNVATPIYDSNDQAKYTQNFSFSEENQPKIPGGKLHTPAPENESLSISQTPCRVDLELVNEEASKAPREETGVLPHN